MVRSLPYPDMDKILSLSKRRGFVFQSSEIYGGLGSTWDYGPLGVELKRHVKEAWWRSVVLERDDMVGLDAAILMNPQVWVASGHVASFTDPLVECKSCHLRYRTDQVTYPDEIRMMIGDQTRFDLIKSSGLPIASETPFDVLLLRGLGLRPPDESTVLIAARLMGKDFYGEKPFTEIGAIVDLSKDERLLFLGRRLEGELSNYAIAFQIPPSLETAQMTLVFKNASGVLVPIVIEDIGSHNGPSIIGAFTKQGVACPQCGGELTDPRQFNLMFKTFQGPVEDTAQVVYLRPETAQGIFVNFANVLTSTRRKLPFGIAQIGKAFRNEITPGNFTFRTREFEQMEVEYFVKPGTDEEWLQRWVDSRFEWYVAHGIRRENLRLRRHAAGELAHYAKDCYDIEYRFPWGWAELEGIANRTNFDLRAHAKASGQDLTYFDESAEGGGERGYPYVIEPSGGVDRATLAFWLDSYDEEPDPSTSSGRSGEEVRVVLHLHRKLAPVTVAVLPLSRNARLVPSARKVYAQLRRHFSAQYDDAQSIGRRYRRQDEIGTPYCVTVDFDTLEDRQVTIRDRDTMYQVRLPIDGLVAVLQDKLEHGW